MKKRTKSKKLKSSIPPCPKCGDAHVWRNGFLEWGGKRHQNYRCSNCDYRFTAEKYLDVDRDRKKRCRICGKNTKHMRSGLCDKHYQRWYRLRKKLPNVTPEEAVKIDLRRRLK